MLILITATLIIQVVVKAEDYVHSPIQYHSQTDSGTYNFGYDTGLFGSHQFHQEYKDVSGQVRGRYGYTDPFGKLRLVHYTSGPQGYEVISDTEADKTPKSSARPKDPVITNVIERYSVPIKPIRKAYVSKPVPIPPTYVRPIITRPAVAPIISGNDKVRTYLAGRDYDVVGRDYDVVREVVIQSPPLATRTVISPAERLRAAALTGRSVDGARVHRSVKPDAEQPEIKPPQGYTKCTCV